MDVLIVLVFVSLLLVGGGLLLLLVGVHQGDFEHADRLSLLPIEEDTAPGAVPVSGTAAAAESSAVPASDPRPTDSVTS